MFAEYAGLEQDVASEIEARREKPSETKNDILRRLFRMQPTTQNADSVPPHLDFGQGIQLPVGERLYLYLTKPKNVDQKPDGMAEVKSDGIYLDGKFIVPSNGSALAPAMHAVQARLNHVNEKGELVSLSAFRQWYVVRDEKLVPLDHLKDPKLRRRRKTKDPAVDVRALLAELGLE
ncbi:MAG: hypothetical protein K2W91_05595 [Novosphingobium sp.]|nr:hypothetical protein [Novosphingobium sp.]